MCIVPAGGPGGVKVVAALTMATTAKADTKTASVDNIKMFLFIFIKIKYYLILNIALNGENIKLKKLPTPFDILAAAC